MHFHALVPPGRLASRLGPVAPAHIVWIDRGRLFTACARDGAGRYGICASRFRSAGPSAPTLLVSSNHLVVLKNGPDALRVLSVPGLGAVDVDLRYRVSRFVGLGPLPGVV